jgi:hypothetical protein
MRFMEEVCGLHQIVSSDTRVTQTSRTLIDHVYVSDPRFVVRCEVIESGLSDHDLIVYVRRHRQMFRAGGKQKWVQYRAFRGMDVEAFRQNLAQMNLEECSRLGGVDDCWNEWYRRFLSILDRHAPRRRKLFRVARPDWMNGGGN